MFGLLFLFGILNAVVQGCSVPRVTQGSGASIGSDLVLNSGTVLHLICEGDCPVTWVPRLAKHKSYISKKIGNTQIFLVNKVEVEFTGTYKCVYKNKNASNTMASVHVFVRDPGALFVSPNFRRLLSKEGKDLLLPCLLTDPNATDFTLRMDNGSAVPYGMNMTFDPRKGVLIHNVQPGFNADYVCSARIGGVEKVSKIFSLNIIERLRFPPYVFLKQNKYVRLVGERFQISCSTNNPNFDYNITWTNSSRTLLHGNERSTIEGERMAIESILTIPSLQLSDSGNITCTGQNEAGANSSTAQLLVVDKPYIRLWPKLSTKLSHQGLSITVSEGDDVDLGVLIEAYPPLTFHHWKTPTSHNASLPESSFYSDNDRYEAMLFLKRLKYEETGFYTLYLQSRMRNASITFHIKMSNTFFTSAMYGSTVAIVVLALLLIFMIYKYKQKPRYEIRWKIIKASDGNNYTFIDPTQLPYNEKWEFPRDKLILGKTLGAGAFGKVVEATAYGLGKEDNITRVAVKMLKACAHVDEREALMSELKILSHLGQHQNIVNLLGACTHGGPVLVITEYCCHGDLLNFLRSKAENFLNVVIPIPDFLELATDYKNVHSERMFIRSDSGISSNCSESYLDMRSTTERVMHSDLDSSSECQEENFWSLDLDDLVRFACQVAQGLEFLSANNCIHRDVAARNVLLTNSKVAKICDFGLARDIMNDSNYVVKGNARLPVKWMAPESIFECVYTVQSDVWSYGILLWEIFSLGKSPYPNILVDSKFYKMIKSGYKMCRPDYAPPEIYELMQMCWRLDAAERPTFSKISQMLQRMLGDDPMVQRMLGDGIEIQETEYQNVQSEPRDEQPESRDPIKQDEQLQETLCEREEDQPLITPNNYQFC